MNDNLNNNLYELIKSRFPGDSNQTLMELEDGFCYTYADLDRESARYARFFTGLGLKFGDRVLAQVEKSPQVLFLYLGCLRAGLIYLPLNTAYLQDELDYFLHDAEPGAIVGSDSTLTTLTGLAEKRNIQHVFCLNSDGSGSLQDHIQNIEPQFETVTCQADDIAAILYTSGTTGRPKGAMITHSNLSSNALALQKAWGWRSDDVLLHALPLFHVHGLFVACHCVLFGGSKMLFLKKFDAETVINLLPHSTVLMGVPTYYTRLLNETAFNADICKNMRLFISGSAPLLEQTFHEFKDRIGQAILERYGMTETGMSTSNPLIGDRIAGTVGPPLPGITARIIDDEEQPVTTPGIVGQLLVKGGNVFKGYWRLPEKTAEEFTEDGYFKTGDLANIDANGYVSIIGRGKDLIISGGLNVYPKEIERTIDDIEGVVESAVIGLPHTDFGEAVYAAVVRESGHEDLTATMLIDELKTKLANFKVPKDIFWVDELPRNTMGKVQKNILRERYNSA